MPTPGRLNRPRPTRFYLESLGCAKNQVDSEELIAALEDRGLRWVDRPEEADWILVNTCGFITSAKEESIQTTLEMKEHHPEKRVMMLGCLVERYPQELRRELPEVDGFSGTVRASSLPEILARLAPEPQPGRPARSSRQPPRRPAERHRLLSYPGSAYVKVAEGCSNHCAYCAIPLIRGELESRPRPAILAEIRRLLASGIREINLVAQDLASFGRDRGAAELASLLREVSRLPGEFWLRLLYLHPDHFPEEILPLMAGDPRLLPYFDIPFQHASPRVLARMGRRGSGPGYLALLERIRAALPQAVFRSTFLLGFPGEREEDFRLLADFQRQARLDWVGLFAYSPEDGAPAYRLKGRVPAPTVRERQQALEEAQQSITAGRLDAWVGRAEDVLVEEEVQGEGLFLGRAWFQAPEVDGLVVLWGSHPRLLRREPAASALPGFGGTSTSVSPAASAAPPSPGRMVLVPAEVRAAPVRTAHAAPVPGAWRGIAAPARETERPAAPWQPGEVVRVRLLRRNGFDLEGVAAPGDGS